MWAITSAPLEGGGRGRGNNETGAGHGAEMVRDLPLRRVRVDDPEDRDAIAS